MSQPFVLPFKILYYRIIEKERNKCEKIITRSVKRRIQYVNIETAIQNELLSFSNGQKKKEEARRCLFKKNKKEVSRRLSSCREQQNKNYKQLGMNLKLHFPNILYIFGHFRNNKLQSYLLVQLYSIMIIDNKYQQRWLEPFS